MVPHCLVPVCFYPLEPGPVGGQGGFHIPYQLFQPQVPILEQIHDPMYVRFAGPEKTAQYSHGMFLSCYLMVLRP